jgi:hypothetical protein
MQPIVKPLSRWRRKLVFGLLLLAFVVSLPAFIFYATGYRYDLSSPSEIFTATGAFYISAETDGSQIFVDDVEIVDARSFRNASYIQGLAPGVHQVHVQVPGLHTWVKKLEVLPHIVTEAESFNLPLVPQVRLVTPYQTSKGESVLAAKLASSSVFMQASTTGIHIFATSTATSSYTRNQEYAVLETLFLEQASTTKLREALKVREIDDTRFSFATTTEEITVATTTVVRDDLRLYESADDIFVAVTTDDKKDIPYYFCQEQLVQATTSESLLPIQQSVDTPPQVQETCRLEIKIDRKGEAVLAFDFHPVNSNLVILQLASGLYLIEVDDRSWQNSQSIYRSQDMTFVVYRGGIYIKENGMIFEVLLELPE